MTTEYEVCNKMIFTDDIHIRCYLPALHVGLCEPRPNPFKFTVNNYYEKTEITKLSTRYKEVSDGHGIFYTVPNWIADALEAYYSGKVYQP